MTYDDFGIRISSAGAGRLSIRVDCEAGEDSVDSDGGLAPASGRSVFARLRAAAGRGGDLGDGAPVQRNLSDAAAERTSEDLSETGQRLFSLLLPPELRSLWERCRALSTARRHGLRLRLHLDLRSKELAWVGELPWELLYDEGSGGFLALDGRTPVVRYLDVRQDRRPFPKVRPWRVLVIMASPEGAAPLDLDTERRDLLATWGAADQVELVFPERPTFDGIRRELTRAPIHGIHYMGHGFFDESTGWGGLLLEGPSGQPAPLLGPAVKQLVRGIEPPALAVLNGCETGRSAAGAGPEPFGGAAAALMEAGVPAVVAMQLPVADEEAIHFSKILYRALQDGLPVDRAVSEARLSLSQAFPDRPAWAIPALFMRVPDGRLFETAEPVEEPAAVDRHGITAVTKIGLLEGTSETTGVDAAAGEGPGGWGTVHAEQNIGKVGKGGKASTTGWRVRQRS